MTMLDQLAWARAPDHEKMPMLRRVALIGSTWKLSVITRARFVLNEHTLDLWARESREIDNRSKIMTVCTILLPIEGDCVLILITSKLFEHFIICIVLFSFFYVLFQIKLLYYQSFCINYQIFLYGLWYVIIKFKKFSKLEKYPTSFSMNGLWLCKPQFRIHARFSSKMNTAGGENLRFTHQSFFFFYFMHINSFILFVPLRTATNFYLHTVTK